MVKVEKKKHKISQSGGKQIPVENDLLERDIIQYNI